MPEWVEERSMVEVEVEVEVEDTALRKVSVSEDGKLSLFVLREIESIRSTWSHDEK